MARSKRYQRIPTQLSESEFNEFVLIAPVGFEQKRGALINEKCIFAGVKLEPFYPELKQHYLFCATETISKADIDQLAKEVQ